MKLNLGCGSDIRHGWENYDKFPHDSRVKFIDLDILPLPFPSDSIDIIQLSQVLEHVLYPLELCVECNRVLKPGGKLLIDVPVYSYAIAHRRPRNTIASFDQLWQSTGVPMYVGDSGFKLIKKYGDRCGVSFCKMMCFRILQMFRDFLHSLCYHHFVWEFEKK